MENAKKFFEEAIKTEEAKAIIAALEKPENEEQTIKAYAEVAEKLGIKLSEEEITKYLSSKKASGDVDDEELDQVTGGRTHSNCEVTFTDYENCWGEDACDIFSNNYDGYYCNFAFY